MDGLFVYGTLLPGQAGWSLLAKFAQGHMDASAAGTLYDTLRGYPTARFGGEGRIRGAAVTLHPASVEEALEVIDEYEGADEGRYRRIQIPVVTPDGASDAWAYDHLGPTDDLVVIPSGDWRTAI